MAISVGAIKATLSLDSSKFDKGVKSAKGTLGGLGKTLTTAEFSVGQLGVAMAGMGAAAGAVAVKLFDVVQGVANVGDEAAKTAQRVGLSIEAMQEFNHVAGLSGVSTSEMQSALRRLGRSAEEARQGVAEYSDVYEQLGVSVTDASGELKSSDQLLMELADTFSALENETQKVALAQDIFGRSGTSLLPMLNQGSAGIAGMRQEAHDLGIVLSESTAKSSEVFNDSLLRMKGLVTGVKNDMAKGLIPQVGELLDTFSGVVRVSGFVGGVLINLSGILGELGTVIMVVGNQVGALAAALGAMLLGAAGQFDAAEAAFDDMMRFQQSAIDGIMSLGDSMSGASETGSKFEQVAFKVADGIQSIAAQARSANKDIKDLDDTVKSAQGIGLGSLGSKYLEPGAVIPKANPDTSSSGGGAAPSKPAESEDTGPFDTFSGGFGTAQGRTDAALTKRNADFFDKLKGVGASISEGASNVGERGGDAVGAISDAMGKVKDKTDEAAMSTEDWVRGIAGVATQLGSAVGLSDELQGALGGVANIATSLASGNIFGAISGGIGLLASLFGGGGSDRKTATSRRDTSPERLADIMAEKFAEKMRERDDGRIVIQNLDARGSLANKEASRRVRRNLEDELGLLSGGGLG